MFRPCRTVLTTQVLMLDRNVRSARVATRRTAVCHAAPLHSGHLGRSHQPAEQALCGAAVSA